MAAGSPLLLNVYGGVFVVLVYPPPMLLICYGEGCGDGRSVGSCPSYLHDLSTRVRSHVLTSGMFALYVQPSFYRGYKPAFYLFVPMQMFYKMALWVTVAFFVRGSTLQVALLVLLTTLRLLFHMVYEPNADFSDNLFDRAILTLTWLVAFGSMVSSNVKMHSTYIRATGGYREYETTKHLWDETIMNAVLDAIVALAYVAVILLLLRSVVKCVCRRSEKCRNRWNKCCCVRRCPPVVVVLVVVVLVVGFALLLGVQGGVGMGIGVGVVMGVGVGIQIADHDVEAAAEAAEAASTATVVIAGQNQISSSGGVALSQLEMQATGTHTFQSYCYD